ncbi:MAG: hypothetical protein ACOX6A_04170 [Atribacter sp.]|uniref:hypothetical protein n=1 Tax=Atribacter sp. TaxID=2847780 RepID=UPI003D966C07
MQTAAIERDGGGFCVLNRVFNPTPKDDPPPIPANKLYLVEPADSSCYQASLKISCDPPEALNRVVCAVYFNNEKVPYSDTQFLPDGTATLVFEHPSSHDSDVIDFTVSAGYDVNGNGLLDDFEKLIPLRVKSSGADIGPAIIRGTSAPRYGTALTQVNGIVNGTVTAPGRAASMMIPHAKALLRIFHQGNTNNLFNYAPTGVNTVSLDAFAPVSGFSEWLTHNAGAPFNPTGIAQIKEYVWDDTRSMGELAMTSAAMKQAVLGHYVSNVMQQAEAELVPGQVAWYPASSQGDDISHVSESPSWVPGSTLEMNSLLPNLIDDLNGTFGRIRIMSHKARFRIRKEMVLGEEVLVVEKTQTWGELQDLYDFNHDSGGAAQHAAILQIGHGNGSQGAARASGVIYRTKVFFNKTYEGLP